MTRNAVFLSSPRISLPRHEASQGRLLDFLTELHGTSKIRRYGVKEDQIARRRFECPDPFLPPSERLFYGSRESSILDKTRFYTIRAKEALDSLFPGPAPDHLIHVTCTGYASPSAAQLLAVDRSWPTEITHAYQMGCYAALPALRLAMGQALAYQQRVEVAHTEICSLHLSPESSPEQLVIQSLFADGHAAYSVAGSPEGASFRVLVVSEQRIPGTAGLMSWIPAPWGMHMTLSREVPQRIRDAMPGFVERMMKEAKAEGRTAFALHPGGPKVIEGVRTALGLEPEQLAATWDIFRERGNMSSATLPHIWREIASRGESDTVVSLAFGPGLTIFGSVFRCLV
jgi:predicted naringenin-chalcone synthase